MIDLHHGDCLEVMHAIPDGSVDMILADPPYCVSRKTNFQTMPRYNTYGGYEFGEWDEEFNQTDWLSIAVPKLRRDANFVLFNDWRNLGLLERALEDAGLDVRRLLVMRKRNPPPHNRDRMFLSCTEVALWATKGRWVFNRFGKYNESVFDTTNNGHTKHPTEKHLPAIEQLVRILTHEGQTVLDPFMGSGTTGVACVNTGRNFIGIEKDAGYYAIAQKRIQGAQSAARQMEFAS